MKNNPTQTSSTPDWLSLGGYLGILDLSSIRSSCDDYRIWGTGSARIAQIIGPVVDVQCTSDGPVSVVVATSLIAGKVTVEVQHLMGDRSYRTVAMRSTSGLRRGERAELLDGPISVPVGRCTLGRIFNVLGDPVDGKGPVKSDEKATISTPRWSTPRSLYPSRYRIRRLA